MKPVDPGDNCIERLVKNCIEAGLLKPEKAQITALRGDASDRGFYRIRQHSAHFIGLISPRKEAVGLDENDSYFFIGRHLGKRRLPVPQILWADLKRGHFLLEDLGDYHLQSHVKRGCTDVGHLYRHAVRLLVRLHREAPRGFQAAFCFDTDRYTPPFVYHRELEYFRKSFLNNFFGMDIGAEDLRSDFENIAEQAGIHGQSQVMHRDFQSRNLMVHRQDLWILDFQGMRFGPPAYDLAALLLDPYVALPTSLQNRLLDYYWTGAGKFLRCSYHQFCASYEVVRLCRNLQILGAYGFLGITRGKREFLQYIPTAWQELCRWLKGPCRRRYPKLERTVAQAQRKFCVTSGRQIVIRGLHLMG